jgi:hypothetical protein
MERLMQSVGIGRNGLGLFSQLLRSVDLPLIATGCNHGLRKGSISWGGAKPDFVSAYP